MCINDLTPLDCTMDSLFTSITVSLTEEYVQQFPTSVLNSKLCTVRSRTGIQFSKAKRTYALTGTWEQVNAAYDALEEFANEINDEKGTSRAEGDALPNPGDNNLGRANGKDKKCPRTLKSDNKHSPESSTADLVKEESLNDAEVDKSQACSGNIGIDKKPVQPNKFKTIDGRAVADSSSKVASKNYLKKDKTAKKYTKSSGLKNKVLVAKNKSLQNNCIDDMLIFGNGDSENCDIEVLNENKSNSSDEIKQDKQYENVSNSRPRKKVTRKPGDEGYWSRVKIDNYNEKHKCAQCDVVLKSRKRYMEHMRRIHIKEFKCDTCERRFGYPTDLNRHKCIGTPDPNNEQKAKGGRPKKDKPTETVFIPCTECDYIGTSKKRFNGHVRRTHRLTFGCDQCDKKFGFVRDLHRHKENVHSEPSHFCDRCSKFYKSKAVFEIHLKTHEEGYVKPKFECQVCEKTFTTKYVLSAHIKTEHLGLKKTYLCQICGKKFSQRNSYKQHSNAHAGIKPYVCDLCGKAFTYHKSLKEHKFMHDNIRRFQCQLCDKAFRQRTTLQIHMKVHKTVKDHICATCGKGFSQKQALERHERIHTGIKPYTCVPCQRTFGDASTIRRHMLAIHQKNETNWRDDIVCNVKRKTDYYVLGGSGQNRTYNRGKNSSSSSDVKNEETASLETQLQTLNPDAAVMLLSAADVTSTLDLKSDYTYNGLSTVQTQVNQLQSNQPTNLYSGSINTQQQQQSQSQTNISSIPLNYNNQIIDFATLSQLKSSQQLVRDNNVTTVKNSHPQQPSSQQQALDGQTNTLLQAAALMPVTSLPESQTSTQIAGSQPASAESVLSQAMSSIWGFVGYPTYYNPAGVTQFNTQQNHQ